MRHNHPARGSALFMILMAVALFAALAFTFSRGMQQGSESLSDRQAELAAADILAFASKTERVVSHMLTGQLSESELSFEGLTGTYTNAACTSDDCKVMAPAGGGLEPVYPITRWLDAAQSAEPFYGTWYITARICVPGIGDSTCTGSTGNELTMVLPYVQKKLCEKIDQKIGIPAVPAPAAVADIDNAGRFNGNFAPAGLTTLTHADLNGRSAGCILDSASETYHFYQVLVAR